MICEFLREVAILWFPRGYYSSSYKLFSSNKWFDFIAEEDYFLEV